MSDVRQFSFFSTPLPVPFTTTTTHTPSPTPSVGAVYTAARLALIPSFAPPASDQPGVRSLSLPQYWIVFWIVVCNDPRTTAAVTALHSDSPPLTSSIHPPPTAASPPASPPLS